jgi:crotonobetainyl-CoA:carnitine CoA-transferase CaiB-like acyl-CoA transferase
LKNPAGREAVWALAETADVVVEQFRPGVMARLGFGFEHVAERNPSVVYCSITGYGQTGARSTVAGHDLNYIGHSGMLSLLDYGEGAALPPALVADVGGGSYPAFINVLLALMSRTPETPATHLDIAMTDNVFPFMYWALACNAATLGPGSHRLTGESPRYRTYRTRDDRLLLVAALEPHFWARFCQAIELPKELHDDQADPSRVIEAIDSIVRERDAHEWSTLLDPWDCCTSIAATVAEAWQDAALHERGVLTGGPDRPALPLPIVPAMRTQGLPPAPDLGDLAWSTVD